MSNTILFVFEGEKIERQMYNSLKKNAFFPENQILIRLTYCGEIFQLWNTVKDDADLDIVEILKERPNSGINDLNRKDVSEVHLFFDHDAHSHSDTISPHDYQKKIGLLLDTFSNEFESGKLWISYPMAEAIKHCKKCYMDCFYDAKLSISKNTNYKKIVNEKSDFKYIGSFNKSVWYYLTAINIQRTFCLVNDRYESVSDYNMIKHWFEQNASIVKQIHEKQYAKFISTKNEIAALSPFPLFLLYYFGKPFFIECKCEVLIKNCNFHCYQR